MLLEKSSFDENKCDECEYKNDTRVQIMYHMQTYPETENKCDKCEYKNDTRVQIIYHMWTYNETENKSSKSLARNESFPAVSLSVKNPVSSKILILLVTLQIFSNIGILYFLYLGME